MPLWYSTVKHSLVDNVTAFIATDKKFYSKIPRLLYTDHLVSNKQEMAAKAEDGDKDIGLSFSQHASHALELSDKLEREMSSLMSMGLQ